jgi:hypothetical protein
LALVTLTTAFFSAPSSGISLFLMLACLFAYVAPACFLLHLQIPGVLSLIEDITLGPYSIMDADHLDPHIAGEK